MEERINMIFRGMRMLFEMGLHGEFHEIAYISGGRRMFLEVLYRGLTAGGIVLVILLLRVLLQRAPKIYCYLLWVLVLYRLLCPFTFVSSVSFLELFDRAGSGRVQVAENRALLEMQMEEAAWKNQTAQSVPEVVEVGVEHEGIYLSRDTRTLLWVASSIWISGMAMVLLYGIVSLIIFSRRLKGAVKVGDNIYLSDYVPTPFVIGLIRPRIYLPSSLEEQEWEYILLHERTHIRRCDHIIRILSFLALAVYWFHPLIWVAFYLSGKDMEMSCDEAVMLKMEKDIRADYAASLLKLSEGGLFSVGTPLAFGEKDARKRIENVMRWRRPKPVIAATVLATVIATVVILGTDPLPVKQQAKQFRQTADDWAQAVCDRDGNRIVELCTKEMREKLENEELLSGEEGVYSFGWSSPWPWDAQKDYRIVECTPQEAVILYYAWTSDPHVTVWRERLTCQLKDSGYQVAESDILCMNSISDSGNFVAAYGEGIHDTPMDYLTNGAGEALNENALQDRNAGGYYQSYQSLFAPQTAARELLNLSEDEIKVAARAGDVQEDGSVTVFIDFLREAVRMEVKMIQPYGEEGIWIPQN